MEDINTLKVADLRRELKDRGLPHTGTKNELVARLQEALSEKPTSDDSVIDEALLDENSLLEGEDDDSNSGAEDVDTSSDNENTNGHEVDTTSSLTKSPEKSPSPQKQTVAKGVVAAPTVASATAIPPTTQKASPEKKRAVTTGEAEDGESTAKKLKINREPIQPPAAKTADAPTSPKEPVSIAAAKSVSSVVAPPEEHDAVKLSTTTLSLAERAKLRQQKFGASEETKPAVANGTDSDKLNKRAARFGNTLTAPATTNASGAVPADEQVRLAKRRERFGKELADTKEAVENQKQKRGQRFGLAAAPATTTTAVTSKDVDEKKKNRAARFGGSV